MLFSRRAWQPDPHCTATIVVPAGPEEPSRERTVPRERPLCLAGQGAYDPHRRCARLQRLLILGFLFTLGSSTAFADGEPRSASIGDLVLESGAVLTDCRVGYRTWGTPAPDGSNVVVLTTWFGGTTESLAGFVGPDRMWDPARYFVVAIDALGNGVSTSPSNSAEAAANPRITIGDMVRSQHALLTGVLGIERAHVVTGLSMGGMQVYDWAFRFPAFAEIVIPIVGTPKQTSHDLAFWGAQAALLEFAGTDPDRLAAAMRAAAHLNTLELWTPEWLVRNVPPTKLAGFMAERETSVARLNPADYLAQLRAMMDHDVYARFDGSIEKAAAAARSRFLIVVATRDETVRPEPSRELARHLRAPLVELEGDCGHLATACERARLLEEIGAFMETTGAEIEAVEGAER